MMFKDVRAIRADYKNLLRREEKMEKIWELWVSDERKNVVCTACKKGFSVLAVLEKSMNLGLYICESCKKIERDRMDMTDKQLHVIDLLYKNVDMPTKDIIADYNEYMEGSISARYVQRIRKLYKKKLKGENMNDDAFDTETGMFNWQIEALNMANEGGWSIQQIAEKIDKPEPEVRDTLTNFHYMVFNQILDEKSDNPYFNNPDQVSSVLSPEDGEEEKINFSDDDENDDFWEVKIDCVTACSKAEKEVDVFLSKKARYTAMNYMKWAKSREWLAYLVGEKKEKGFYIQDLYLPDQKTSYALVDKVVADKYNHMKVVGVIHSHHDMGAGDEDNPSFSGHDAAFINGNHNLSLLAGKNGGGFKIVGIARVKTPCGALMQVKASVKTMVETPSEEENTLKNEFFLKVFEKNIEDKSIVVVEDKNENGSGSYHFTNNPTINRTQGGD